MKYFQLLLLIFSLTAAFAQDQNEKEVRARKLQENERLILDGKIEEEAWAKADVTSGFKMQVPIEGGEPTEKTEIRITYDESNLYIGVVLYDSNPEGIKAFQRKWDTPLRTDDRFMWILDTFLDKRNAFFFEINPAGLHGDGLLKTGQGDNLNKDWNGIWRAWTYIGDFGWSAEIRIPFRSIGFDPDQDTWGINFQRTIRRKNEELLWTGHRRNQGLFRPQDAGILTGLSGISQGIGLEAVPFGIVRRTQEGAGDQANEDWSADGGLDINYNITSNLEASVTVNTDFAETEVDDRRINLTRFPLFFPEKRDFFLEGSGIFDFAPRSFVNPFFSRRIGLAEGKQIPILYGGRLLGRVGDFNLGALQVHTRKQDTLKAEDFTAIRVVKNIFRESTLGIIYTRRSTRDGEDLVEPLQDRHTFGADLELQTSEFLGNNNLQFQAFFVGHNTAYVNDDSTDIWDRSSRGIRLNFPNQPWSGHVSYREFGDFFDPAVGFNPRNGFRRVQPSISYEPLFEKSNVIRSIEWGIRFEHLMDLDWKLLTQDLNFNIFEIRFETGDNIELSVGREFERLQEDFDILRDGSIIIPEDKYIVWETSIELRSASYRRLSGGFEFNSGGFWTGNRKDYQFDLGLRPLAGINLRADYNHSDVNLPEGSFSTDLFRFEGSFDLNPFISFTSNIQFDNVSNLLGINNRFRWIITPGTDVFLVYNHTWIDDPLESLITLENQATFKVKYTHRF